MTDADLLSLHKTFLDVSNVAALHAIYNLGYANGASVTPSAGMTEYSLAQAKPSDSTISILKTFVAQKRKGDQ